ncbi:low molecular weight protein arginine phosphatase [Pseudogracilibacillus auburnensis]|uniref:low molecular weight protein arginine phosphatase n=1 Tax=Pseudogracilibacillus auburnensis TaxID=1494959 RepID=UPI001A96A458|nr:low molecular weight protein arginine phosphatase [Pseudogracilibacillus auburnensis]MBO1004800.1 low molecular weight protein arginine phosphatase [Pseudogracilibacillus auburnensis]
MNILFVCTGNTCRSPMAAAIFNHLWSEKGEARSVGLFAANGANAAAHTVQVLKEEEIEINHSSKQLDVNDVEWASLVLTMTSQHKAMLMSQFPGAADKIFTLKEYVDGPDGELDIQDPYGGDLHIYRSTHSEMKALIERIFEK